jgi:hypothetical protein
MVIEEAMRLRDLCNINQSMGSGLVGSLRARISLSCAGAVGSLFRITAVGAASIPLLAERRDPTRIHDHNSYTGRYMDRRR